MQALLAPLLEFADYQEIVRDRKKNKGIIQVAGCTSSQKTHLMYALGDGCEYRVIAFSGEEKAKKAYEEYRIFTDAVFLYPARDLLFYYADIKGKTITDRRMEVLRTLIEKKKRTTGYSHHYHGCLSRRSSASGRNTQGEDIPVRRGCDRSDGV